jgi:hypothetical protein
MFINAWRDKKSGASKEPPVIGFRGVTKDFGCEYLELKCLNPDCGNVLCNIDATSRDD